MITKSRLGPTYVRAKINGTADDGTSIDPATLAVEIAVVPAGTQPADTDWYVATHLYGDRFGLLCGAGALDLPAGDYDTWRRIADVPEIDVARFGQIRFE